MKSAPIKTGRSSKALSVVSTIETTGFIKLILLQSLRIILASLTHRIPGHVFCKVVSRKLLYSNTEEHANSQPGGIIVV